LFLGSSPSAFQFDFGIKRATARHWWLTPVILATQEAKIRSIMV
jgi:hypothetical protein